MLRRVLGTVCEEVGKRIVYGVCRESEGVIFTISIALKITY